LAQFTSFLRDRQIYPRISYPCLSKPKLGNQEIGQEKTVDLAISIATQVTGLPLPKKKMGVICAGLWCRSRKRGSQTPALQLYIAGRIAAKILPLMQQGLSQHSSKGRMNSLLEQVLFMSSIRIGLIGSCSVCCND